MLLLRAISIFRVVVVEYDNLGPKLTNGPHRHPRNYFYHIRNGNLGSIRSSAWKQDFTGDVFLEPCRSKIKLVRLA